MNFKKNTKYVGPSTGHSKTADPMDYMAVFTTTHTLKLQIAYELMKFTNNLAPRIITETLFERETLQSQRKTQELEGDNFRTM